MFYTESIYPRVADCDRKGFMSYEAVMQILENAGSHHSDLVNDPLIAGSRTGTAWIVTEWRARVLRCPESTEKLTVSTWITSASGSLILYRDFEVTDESGEVIVCAEAKLCRVDLTAMHPVRIPDELLAVYEPEEKQAFTEKAPHLRAPKEYSSEMPMPALRRGDIDINGHLHNTRYLTLALDILPEEVFARGSEAFSGFRIQYSQGILEGDVVTVKYAEAEDAYRAGFYRDGKLCTLIELTK